MSSRAQRRAAQQVERRRRQRRRWLWRSLGILALLGIGGLAYLALLTNSGSCALSRPTAASTTARDDKGDARGVARV
jgi:hypothetical protein